MGKNRGVVGVQPPLEEFRPDLIVFENAFRFGGAAVFAEPGIVGVSDDAVSWTDFSFSSAYLVRKCLARSGMSSVRSRSGGSSIEITASR